MSESPDTRALRVEALKAHAAAAIAARASARLASQAAARAEARLARQKAWATGQRRDTEKFCHCGYEYRGSDHCGRCGCEQYETQNVRACPHA